MRVISITAENFGSYDSLILNPVGKGLTLISGPTGAGKSTLCDVIPWTLFGKTAKNGAADEVRSWPGNVTTKSTALIDIGNKRISVTRTRGPNDLYFGLVNEDKDNIRGKDLNDTQKQINQLLGMDIDLYLASSYYHEFSQTVQFFTAPAKIRRQLTEQLVDLSLPVTLQNKISAACKEIIRQKDQIKSKINSLETNLETFSRLQNTENDRFHNWKQSRADKIAAVRRISDNFEKDKKHKITELTKKYESDLKVQRETTICPECGNTKTANHTAESHYIIPLNIEKDKVNPYIAQLRELEEAENPHKGAVKDFSEEIKREAIELQKQNILLTERDVLLVDLDILAMAVIDLRTISVKSTIDQLEYQINELLSKYFDAELKVQFDIEENDKLEVLIQKDGNNCSFTQLSKGQRQLLKFCFSLSVMKAIKNFSNINTNVLFLDEAMDGLDSNFKIKAVQMLENITLDYDSIFLVEHSIELKSMINNQIKVLLTNGVSQLEET